MEKIIGFSTGFAYETVNQVSREVIGFCRSLGCRAIEINCLSGAYDQTLYDLFRLEESDLDGFDHVSVHAPSRHIKYDQNLQSRALLELIQSICNKFSPRINQVVFHPDTFTNEGWKLLNDFIFPMAFENMELRKDSFRDVKDMTRALSHPHYSFVLDLMHCYWVDYTMKLFGEFMKNFADKLCEVHISGYNCGHHFPLYKAGLTTGQGKILDAARKLDVPIIIESNCADFEEARKEYEYILGYLR